MCGLAGIIAWDEAFRVSRELLQSMSAAIAHRGPDGAGFYLSQDGPIAPQRPQVALAHRRLAILDPEPRANQPLADRHGRWIVFNGEIFNFRDLRRELTALSHDEPWHTTGDTEVLLRAYGQWGEGALSRLTGMFALAIWDEPRQSLFLARDRMGQKPLYIATIADKVTAFASELSALAALPWFSGEIDRRSLVNYLRYGYIGGSASIYLAAGKALPSQWRRISASGESSGSFFDRRAASPIADASLAAATRARVTEAVVGQLVSDVPLGVLLSGGIDSSIVAAAARAAGPVSTFSAGFDDPRYDESAAAAAVARHLGTQHHLFHVRPEAAEDLPRLAAVYGEPFADSSALPTHYLARATRQHVKVALSGDGGDELFGGYDRYRAIAFAERFSGWTGRLLAKVGEPFAKGRPKRRLTRAGRFAASLGLEPAARYDQYMRLFPEPLLRSLLREPIELEPAVGALFEALRPGRDPVQTAAAVDRETYLPEDLLTKVDRASMLHALEVRSPFMDERIVALAAGLASSQMIAGGPKRLLREAFAPDLPPWVFTRRKMGFAVPIGDWFRGSLRPMLRDHLGARDSFASQHFDMSVVGKMLDEHEAAAHDHSQRLYALLMLELWSRIRPPRSRQAS